MRVHSHVASCCVHVLHNCVQLHMHILVVTLVYSPHCTVASCSTVVSSHCTRLDSLQARRGFCTRVLHCRWNIVEEDTTSREGRVLDIFSVARMTNINHNKPTRRMLQPTRHNIAESQSFVECPCLWEKGPATCKLLAECLVLISSPTIMSTLICSVLQAAVWTILIKSLLPCVKSQKGQWRKEEMPLPTWTKHHQMVISLPTALSGVWIQKQVTSSVWQECQYK